VNARLRKQQNDDVAPAGGDPLDELVLTVLSQHTSDLNSGRAFAALKARFSSWDEVTDVPTEELADVIRSGGLANIKAARIQQIFREIEEREGSVTLERFDQMSDDEVEQFLVSLPGVGPKTAACVIAFALARPAFPIDTHVHRIIKRLGWIDEKASADRAHRDLTPKIPAEIRYELHRRFIRHGREICKAHAPHCTICPVFDFCEAGPRFLAEGVAR
jgi:endonuclease-3